MNELGQYLEEMRLRHQRLSVRQMAIQAGVGESIINGIIKHERGARPETLWKIAQRWGDPVDRDYAELMRRAGHPLPDPMEDARGGGAAFEVEPVDVGWMASLTLETIQEMVEKLSPRDRMLWLLGMMRTLVGDNDEDDTEPPGEIPNQSAQDSETQ